MDTTPRRVAIACQGGGSHTAFTAGVLDGLLEAHDPTRHEIVGLSGTSGGAICAALAWDGLRRGGPALARGALAGFWADNAASRPLDRLANTLTVWAGALSDLVVTPSISPYDSYSAVVGRRRIRTMLDRHIDFAGIGVDAAGALPMLLVGAVDVLSGQFVAFNSRRDRVSADVLLASAAIPRLFRAVHLDGATYWDGQFSQNPPIRELLDVQPDEIWVIQVNPQRSAVVPRTVTEIADRRNELAGNLSLQQELYFIEQINRLIDGGMLRPTSRHSPTVVRLVELTRTRSSRSLGATSKLNRDPAFITELIDHGRERAASLLTALAFEDAWSRRDGSAVRGHLADDVTISAAPPFDVHAGTLDDFVGRLLHPGTTVDGTRRLTVADRVSWPVLIGGADRATAMRGALAAGLHAGRITDLRLGPPD